MGRKSREQAAATANHKHKKQQQDPANPPPNWPADLVYLTRPAYSPRLTPADRHLLTDRPGPGPGLGDGDLPSLPPLPVSDRSLPPLARIKPITDPAHPARGQKGLFATRFIPAGQLVVEYLGVVHGADVKLASPPPPPPAPPAPPPAPPPIPGTSTSTTTSSSPHATSNYDLALLRTPARVLAIDAARAGNEARFVNDYRGVAAAPNVEFRDVFVGARGERGVAIWAVRGGGSSSSGSNGGGKKKGIRKGEELLVSYGKGFWGARVAQDAGANQGGEGS